MTISSTTRIAGPFTGTGVATTFPFSFKVFQASDLYVVKLTVSTGVETVLTVNTDYTVTLNGNQDSNPGGNVILPAVLASGYTLTISSDIANLQPTDLTNQGGFYPEVITDALDRATIQIQQLSDLNARSMLAPISDGLTQNLELPSAITRANKYLAFDATGTPLAATGTNTPGISFPGEVDIISNNGGTNNPAARDIVFNDYNTELMRVKGATGRVGIGTDAPAAGLHVKTTTGVAGILWNPNALTSANACYLRFDGGASGGANTGGYVGFGGAASTFDVVNYLSGPIRFFTSNAERMNIDSSGQVGIGVTTPQSTLDLGAQARGRGLTWSDGSSSSNNIFSSYSGAGLVFASGIAGSISADTYVSPSSASMGRVMIRTDAYGANAGTIKFYTDAPSVVSQGTAITPTERMRIGSAGNIGIGASDSSNIRLLIRSIGTTSSTFALYATNGTNTLFTVRDDGAFHTGGAPSSPYNLTAGSAANVYVGNDGVLYRSTSSLKYKIDVHDAAHGLADVMKLRAVTYKGNGQSDGDHVFGGLIAEEVHAAGLTEFVQYTNDGTPDALAYGNMVSLAFKAIQELKAIVDQQAALITAQAARITALETKM